MDDTGVSVEEWGEHQFHHPVTDPRWYEAEGAPLLAVDPSHAARLVVETFERSTEMLACYSDEQVNQGLWYLVSFATQGDLWGALNHESVDDDLKVRVLNSFVPLFETTLAERCTHHLSHTNDPGCGALNSACYMWWDVMGYWGAPEVPSQRAVDMVALSVMDRILAIPHDACRESALHGLGHVHLSYPDEVATIIDRWLRSASRVRSSLRDYAAAARSGMVQ